jgi:uncharacterized membrane protein
MQQLLHGLAIKGHAVSWWIWVVGALVLLLNHVLGLRLDPTQFTGVAGVIASMVLGNSYVAGKAAASVPMHALPPATGQELLQRNAAASKS